MRWTRLRAERFGPLRRWERTLTEPIVVFYGKNEAGKSTVMELLCTLLFGSPRKKAEARRLISWGSSSYAIEGELERDSGEVMTVQRSLKSAGMKSALQQGATLSPLEEGALPWLSPVDRELYRNIYALSLHDLIFPGPQAWSMTQDQLLTGAAQLHRPASQVREELYRSAMSLWRPDRRGKTRMEAMDGQLRELYDRLYSLRDGQHRARELEEQEAALQEQLAELREQQSALWQQLEEAGTLRDRASRVEEGRQLMEEAGDLSLFDALEGDVEQLLQDIRHQQSQLAQQVIECSRSMVRISDRLARITPRETALLEHAEEIEQLSAQYGVLKAATEQLPSLRQALTEHRQRTANYLDGQLREPFARSEPLRLSPAHLQQAADRAREARIALLQVRDQLMAARRRARSPWPWILGGVGLLLLAAGAAALPSLGLTASILPLQYPFDWIISLSAAALGAAGVALAAPVSHIIKKRHLGDLRQQLIRLTEEDAAALHQLTVAARPLYPRESLLQDPAELIARCGQYASMALEEDRLERSWQDAHSTATSLGGQIQALAREFLPERSEDPAQNLLALAEALDEARLWQLDADGAEDQLRQERTRLTQLKGSQQAAVDEEQRLRELLDRLPGESIGEKVDYLTRARQAAARGAALMDTAGEQTPPSVAELDARMDGLQQQLDAVTGQLQEKYSLRGSVLERLEQSREQPSEEELTREIEAMTDKQAQLTRFRDREALLFGLIRVAEQRFRDRHQPDVVRRASAYLSQITAGRYDRIVMSEDQQGIRLYSAEAGEFIDPVKVNLSQGAGEQVFLALRLALIDHLDPSGERLPLLLDETFVNWDHDRLLRCLSVLKGTAAHRQILLFTCHPWMLDALEEADCSYQKITLEDR